MGNLKVLEYADNTPGMSFCKCGTHGFLVEAWPEDGVVSLAMWQYGTGTTTLWSRLRAIWHIIWTGHPYADQLTLDKEGVADLIRHLSILHRKL